MGLPDPLLGSAWPTMYTELDVPLSYMGLLSMIIAMGTIVSSLFTDRLTRLLGTGLLTAVSVLMTAVAMFGFSVSDSYALLCLWAIPFGLGAGAVDASLNSYVALHYKAKHMSWLHCFWGVGTVIGPYIMGFLLTFGNGWHSGYFTVSVIQLILALLIFASLPCWKRNKASSEEKTSENVRLGEILKTKGLPFMLVAFFCYCSLEATAGQWASSYLCKFRSVAEETAAIFASLFYLGITTGRLLSGFVTDKLGDKRLIRSGMITIIVGIAMVMLPVKTNMLSFAGLFVTGFGCAPIYPSLIHATPDYFGKKKAASIVGIQLASAYLGINFMPTLFGFLTDNIWTGLYPFYLIIFAFLMIFMFESLDKSARKINRNSEKN